jgi:hypothetical protein
MLSGSATRWTGRFGPLLEPAEELRGRFDVLGAVEREGEGNRSVIPGGRHRDRLFVRRGI